VSGYAGESKDRFGLLLDHVHECVVKVLRVQLHLSAQTLHRHNWKEASNQPLDIEWELGCHLERHENSTCGRASRECVSANLTPQTLSIR